MKNSKNFQKLAAYVFVAIVIFVCGVCLGKSCTSQKLDSTDSQNMQSKNPSEQKGQKNVEAPKSTEQSLPKTEEKKSMPSKTKKELTTISFGEPVLAETKYGNFEIQIDKVEKTTYGETGSEAIAIKCIVNNINYVGSFNQNALSGYDIAELNNFLQMTDENRVAYSHYDLATEFGEYALAHELQIGSKAREAYMFLVPYGTKSVSVIINNEYILHADI